MTAEGDRSAGDTRFLGRPGLTRRTAAFAALAVVCLAAAPSFIEYVYLFMVNQASVIRGRWDLVALNVGVFVAFAVPLGVALLSYCTSGPC